MEYTKRLNLYLNKNQSKGNEKEFPSAKELLRYGVILFDNEFENEKGHIREREIMYNGVQYRLNMVNGEVTHLSECRYQRIVVL